MAYQELKQATGLCLPAAMGALLLTMPAAADEAGDSKITTRQVVHCMMKRLKADRTESYQAAFKTCKQELDTAQAEPRTDTAMNTAISRDTPKQQTPAD
jgi:hypothetical protein